MTRRGTSKHAQQVKKECACRQGHAIFSHEEKCGAIRCCCCFGSRRACVLKVLKGTHGISKKEPQCLVQVLPAILMTVLPIKARRVLHFAPYWGLVYTFSAVSVLLINQTGPGVENWGWKTAAFFLQVVFDFIGQVAQRRRVLNHFPSHNGAHWPPVHRGDRPGQLDVTIIRM